MRYKGLLSVMDQFSLLTPNKDCLHNNKGLRTRPGSVMRNVTGAIS